MKQSRSQQIERLRNAHPDEWLLIEVDRFDPRTTTPLTGRLVAHSKLLDPIEKRQVAHSNRLLYLVHGSDDFPEGYAAAF